MQCPKCNAEIPEGYLYCPECGEEIIIVSDFEIKLEDNIDTTVFTQTTELPNIDKAVTQDLGGGVPVADNRNKKGQYKGQKHKGDSFVIPPKAGWIIAGVCFVVVIFAAVMITKNVKSYLSFDVQYEQAKELYDAGDFNKAVKKVKHAISIDDSQVKAYVLLSDIYCAQNKYDAAIAILMNALDEDPSLVALYDRVIKCYESQGDYASIHSLLEYTQDNALIARYPDYFSVPPEFSLAEGTYVSPDPIVLSSPGEGVIYYTTDGTEPTTDSLVYSAPIPLEIGDTYLSAIFINDKGIQSAVRTYKYTVELNIPDVPKLLTADGSYNVPNPVGVEEIEGVTVYYTRDGSTPTDESEKYELPLFMPIGKSTFTFIAQNADGIYSEPISVTYDLALVTVIDKAVAEYAVSYQLLSTGDTKVGYTYSCQSAYAYDANVYFIIDEMNANKATGRIFAVDATTGSLYRVAVDGENKKYNFKAM